jgi:2-polyprenyl-3-methyl-5-hydroxy-6-metoxy-1,4-benzoquinol methylase
VYLDPRPAADELDTIYPPEYEPFHFHETRNPFVRYGRAVVQRRKAAAIASVAPEEATILDIGCGSGQLLELLRRYGRPAWRLVGNDFSEVAVRNLERLGLEALPGRFEEIDTPLRFDVAILNQAIEHLERPSRVFEKAAAFVKPGGVIVIETPSLDGLDARLFRRRHWGGYHFPRHWTLFTAETLARHLSRHGFEPVRVDYLPSPAFWCQSLHHVLLDRGAPRRVADLSSIRNPLPLAFFTAFDLAVGRMRPTSNMRLVARRVGG